MPNFEFNCEEHGPFDKLLSFSDSIPSVMPCPESGCGKPSGYVLRGPAGVFMKGGGTGAGRGYRPARAQAASDDIRNMHPADKAAVQRENVYKESGLEISDKATEKVAKELASRG